MTRDTSWVERWIPPQLAPAVGLSTRRAAATSNGIAGWLPELETERAAPQPPARTEADEAYERGRDEGLREGEARAREALSPAIEAIGRVTESFDVIGQSWVCDRERDLEGLALAVARKLVQRELAADPVVLRELIARALELMPADSSLEIRLHPEDLAAVGDDALLLAGASNATGVRWVPDAALARGDFLVESPLRIVDGRTDIALRTLYERLDQS